MEGIVSSVGLLLPGMPMAGRFVAVDIGRSILSLSTVSGYARARARVRAHVETMLKNHRFPRLGSAQRRTRGYGAVRSSGGVRPYLNL